MSSDPVQHMSVPTTDTSAPAPDVAAPAIHSDSPLIDTSLPMSESPPPSYRHIPPAAQAPPREPPRRVPFTGIQKLLATKVRAKAFPRIWHTRTRISTRDISLPTLVYFNGPPLDNAIPVFHIDSPNVSLTSVPSVLSRASAVAHNDTVPVRESASFTEARSITPENSAQDEAQPASSMEIHEHLSPAEGLTSPGTTTGPQLDLDLRPRMRTSTMTNHSRYYSAPSFISNSSGIPMPLFSVHVPSILYVSALRTVELTNRAHPASLTPILDYASQAGSEQESTQSGSHSIASEHQDTYRECEHQETNGDSSETSGFSSVSQYSIRSESPHAAAPTSPVMPKAASSTMRRPAQETITRVSEQQRDIIRSLRHMQRSGRLFAKHRISSWPSGPDRIAMQARVRFTKDPPDERTITAPTTTENTLTDKTVTEQSSATRTDAAINTNTAQSSFSMASSYSQSLSDIHSSSMDHLIFPSGELVIDDDFSSGPIANASTPIPYKPPLNPRHLPSPFVAPTGELPPIPGTVETMEIESSGSNNLEELPRRSPIRSTRSRSWMESHHKPLPDIPTGAADSERAAVMHAIDVTIALLDRLSHTERLHFLDMLEEYIVHIGQT